MMELPSPPSERDWTPEEQDEFYKSLGDSIFSGISREITNAPVSVPSEPLTLDNLLKMKAEMDAKLAEIGPLPFKNGADMSQETWEALKKQIPPSPLLEPIFNPLATAKAFMGVDIHIRPDIPFGETRECTCEDWKVKFKILEGPPTTPFHAEIIQILTHAEIMRRYPLANLPALEPEPSPRHILKDKDGNRALCGGPGLCKWCDALMEKE